MSSFSVIHKLLEDRAAAITAIPLFQRENTRIERSPGKPWSRFTFLPAPSKQKSIGVTGKNQLQGLAQVDLFYPADKGTTDSGAMADLVLASFPRGLTLTEGVITVIVEISWQEASMRVDQYYQVPVIVKWRVNE